jgi:hypothetical protein
MNLHGRVFIIRGVVVAPGAAAAAAVAPGAAADVADVKLI